MLFAFRILILDQTTIPMKKAIIGDRSYQIDLQNDEIILDGKPFPIDISKIDAVEQHVLLDGKSYQTQIASIDKASKTVSIKVNNIMYEVQVKDNLDLLLEKLGMESQDKEGDKEVKAPMPGLILEVLVENGQEVKKGDQLLILEAMKMENVIKSPTDGVVADLNISKGDSVEKGKILMSL